MSSGQLAYNAYCGAMGFMDRAGNQLPHWGQLSDMERAAWQAVANALNANSGPG